MVIFAEQVLIFEYDDNVTAYRNNSNPSLFLPVAGETYTITWDGTEYICKAVADEDAGMVRMGNLLPYGGEDTGEPFVISSMDDGEGMSIFTFDTAETHTMSVYQTSSEETEQPEEEQPTDEDIGVTITLYDRTGEAVNYDNIETITTDTPDAEKGATFTYGVAVENAEYEPDFSNGNKKVILEKGQLLKEFTLVKPETLLPKYIKKGVEVAGVLGDFAGDETEKTVELNMADGNQVIEADEDTVMTKVTVNKPTTMIPENIKKDVEIGGVIGTFIGDGQEKTVVLAIAEGNQIIEADQGTVLKKVIVEKPKTLIPSNIADGIDIGGVVGTLKAGGGSSSGYTVKVIDYDGTVIVEEKHATGDTFTLPDAPTHERLVFDSWSSPVEIIDNTITVEDYDILIGATYYTASGATEIDIELNQKIGLMIKFNSVLSGYTSIDWGDGTVDTSLTHTYSDYGKYTIKIYGITQITSSSTTTQMVYVSYAYAVQAVHLSKGINYLGSYVFNGFNCMNYCTIPSDIGTTSLSYAFYACNCLKSFIVPSGIVSLAGTFQNAWSLENCVIPNSVTTIGGNAFQYCYALSELIIPNSVTTIGGSAFHSCYSLKSDLTRISKNIVSIGTYAFNLCYSVKGIFTIAEGITTLNNYAFYDCHCIEKIVFPSTITKLNANSLYRTKCKEYDFAKCTAVPTLAATSVFQVIRNDAKIKVPASLYDSWIVATNWSTYADHIVAV